MSSDHDERTVNGLRVRIDRSLCSGFGDCIDEASAAFRLDEDGVVVFVDPASVDRGQLLRACDACPVDAIEVWDADGRQVVPETRVS